MRPSINDRLYTLLCFLALVVGAFAEDPSWKEIEAAAQANDLARLEAWVRKQGTTSSTAANVLIAAAQSGHRETVDRLLALGISPNATNAGGARPLLNLAYHGHTGMVRYFLQHGAKANVMAYCGEPDCKGHTPLFHAVCHQDLEMARLLLESGADPRAGNDAAIEKADASGDVELFLLLKQSGARPRSSDPAGQTASSEPAIPLASLGLTELLPAKAGRNEPQAKAKGRLSVIADDVNLGLADLLAARLSGQALLELVERQELDRILAEQKLNRHFAADAANYGRVADLLRADALLLINERKLGGTTAVECRLIRVNPGLVLDTVYCPAPLPSPERWAERMTTRVASLAGKVIRNDAIALALVSIRASVGSAESRGLDRTLTVLLSDRFAHHPRFVPLERQAMQRLESEATGPFWTGSYLVDGTVEPALDGSGAFSFSLRFLPTRKGEALTFTAKGNRNNPGEAVDNLLGQINARLGGLPSPVQRQPAEEAEWYHEEANWALAADQPAHAQSAAEAAWALGLQTLEVARLRVRAAMQTVRRHDAPGFPGLAPSLDTAMGGLTVWRETLHGRLLQERPEGLQPWLALGLEATDDALLALIRIRTASDQIRHAERLEALKELTWNTLEEIRTQSAPLPPGSNLDNVACEKQAAAARLIFPQISRYLPAAKALLSRTFKQDNTLTRARIRSNLVVHWDHAGVMVQTSRTTGGMVSLALPPRHEACLQVAAALHSSPAPEDRYVSALLAIRAAGARHEAEPAHLDRLRSSLFDMVEVLAAGGEVFTLYWDRFQSLDNLAGVPFFVINRTFSPSGDRMWERNTPEHTELRRQLFLRIAAVTQAPAADFKKLISLDQYTPEQAAEVNAAQVRLGGRSSPPPIVMRGGAISRPGPGPAPAPTVPPPTSPGAPALEVRRLWNPFDLGLELVPEFRADYTAMTWEGDRIWLHGCTLDRGGKPDRHFIFAIEPGSMRTETFPIPQPSGSLNARLIVTATHLLFVCQDYLAVRDRAAGRWETYKELRAAGLSRPARLGDWVYLIVQDSPGNALIGFDFRKRTTEVLASTRRRPALSPLDDPALEIRSVAPGQGGDLIVNAGRVRQAWSPARRTWNPLPPAPAEAGGSIYDPTRPEFASAGMVGKRGGIVGLHFRRPGVPMSPIPLVFAGPTRVSLPVSRYGPQNIRPETFVVFPGGLALVPPMGAGFWVIPQKDLDDYLQQHAAGSKPAQSASNQTPRT